MEIQRKIGKQLEELRGLLLCQCVNGLFDLFRSIYTMHWISCNYFLLFGIGKDKIQSCI